MSRRRGAAVGALAVVLAGTLVAGVSAAAVEPRALVLRQADLPPHYDFRPASSGDVRSVGAPDELARPGLLGGYYATYWLDDASSRTVVSAAYVYRSAAGPKAALAAVDRAARRNAPPSLLRRAASVGQGGWAYTGRVSTGRTGDPGTSIAWRFGRVLAVVNCSAPSGHEKLAFALARKQQRRIAAALR